jgi:hypothetical protein
MVRMQEQEEPLISWLARAQAAEKMPFEQILLPGPAGCNTLGRAARGLLELKQAL